MPSSNFNNIPKFFIGWFILCGVLAVSGLGFTVFIVVKVCQHFGIL